MRMHLEGVKNATPRLQRLPRTAPTSVPITVAMTASTFPSITPVAAIASEDISKTGISIAIRSASVPTSITGVVAVNKLLALLIKAAISASTASLAHGLRRHADENHETQNQNSK